MPRDAALFLDMLLAASDAVEFVDGMDQRGFEASSLHQAAVIRCLEIIGERHDRDAGPADPRLCRGACGGGVARGADGFAGADRDFGAIGRAIGKRPHSLCAKFAPSYF